MLVKSRICDLFCKNLDDLVYQLWLIDQAIEDVYRVRKMRLWKL